MTREEAITRLNTAGISVVANTRDWAMGNTIFVGVSPAKVMGVIAYKSILYLKEDAGCWGFEPVMYAGGESPALWFDNLEAATNGLISFLKAWSPRE